MTKLDAICHKLVVALGLVVGLSVGVATAADYSLRFYGTGLDQVDRVKIPIDAPEVPADIGSTVFTIEFWMKMAASAVTTAYRCYSSDGDGWINGHVIIDRDIYGSGREGDFGISVYAQGLAFGVGAYHSAGRTLCGAVAVADGHWHHIAAVYQPASAQSVLDGQLRLYVDGRLDATQAHDTTDISYLNGRATSYPQDPYLVLGAEKHDADRSRYPSYNGLLDDLRLSDQARYSLNFIPPSAPLSVDAHTLALYSFDEGSGGQLADVRGLSPGYLVYGGSPAGPEWCADTPFHASSASCTPASSGEPDTGGPDTGGPVAGDRAAAGGGIDGWWLLLSLWACWTRLRRARS